jgi:hypothetical protein
MENLRFEENLSNREVNQVILNGEKAGKLKEEVLGFEKAASFDNLYEILRELGGVKGSQRFYNNSELIERIEFVRNAKKNGVNKDGIDKTLKFITNTGGLRTKVRDLLNNEVDGVK